MPPLPDAGSRAESQLLAISGSVSDAIVCADEENAIVFWNAAAERMFGWPAAEAHGRPLTIVIPERYQAAHLAGVERLREGGEPRLIGGAPVELHGRHRDGHEFPMELTLGRFSEDGHWLFTGVLRDVTERRRQQRYRDAQLAVAGALAEPGDETDVAERVLDALGRTMGWSLGAVWLLDDADERLHCAAIWTRGGLDPGPFRAASEPHRLPIGFGLPGRAAELRSPSWMTDASADRGFLRRHILSDMGLRGAVALPMVTDDGVVGVVEFYTEGVAEPDAEEATAMEALCFQLGLLFLRKRAERAAEEAAAETRARALELERSNRELDQFASIASHDLSEPLRTVTGFLDILRRRHGDELSPPALELLDLAVGGATRMRSLIDGLLAYSRSGTDELVHDPVDLGEVGASVVAALGGNVAEVGGEVRIVGELPVVRGDRERLEQVLQNLMANGLKFHGDDPPVVTVAAVAEDPGWWRIVIEDNGIGIDAGDEARAFEMFGRLHHRDLYPGTGIGLAVVKRVVERHGGRIWHEPRPGGGSRFCFTLPAVD
ncbi:MAG TPA: ATP-binding protein [Solirubrobacteraceae bacterium]